MTFASCLCNVAMKYETTKMMSGSDTALLTLLLHHVNIYFFVISIQGVCTEAGMYALRERRVHVTQEDFELAVAKVSYL